MRSMRQRLAAVTLLAGLTTLGTGLSASPATAAVIDCQLYLGNPQGGSLHLTSLPAPGSEVEPGSGIDLEASWNAGDFEETDRLYVCATVDGQFDEPLSSQHKSLDNDGTHSVVSTLPASIPPGSEVCFLSALKGNLVDGGPSSILVSETLCFRTAAAATSTTTAPPSTTTTTMAPTTTTTAAPAEDPVTTAGNPAAPAVEVEPAAEPAPLPELPRTGTAVGLLAGSGGVALALGGLARFLGRRRPAAG